MAAAAVAALLAGGAAFAGEPRIEALEQQYDFGQVAEGARLEHIFPVRNAGGGELIIERVQPS